MNSRRDGILREMGLAPLWRLRGAEGVEEVPVVESAPPEPVVRAPEMPPSGVQALDEATVKPLATVADFVGGAYFPETLARAILENRVRWQDAFYVPCDRDLYDSLLFHLAYQKAEACKADALDPLAFRSYKRYAFVKELAQRLGQPFDLSLLDMHRLLKERGYGIDQPRWSENFMEPAMQHIHGNGGAERDHEGDDKRPAHEFCEVHDFSESPA